MRVRGGRLLPLVGAVRPLEETREAFKAKAGTPGKIVIDVA